MLYLLIALMTFNTALLYYISWHLVDYFRWKRSSENDNV